MCPLPTEFAKQICAKSEGRC